MDNESFWRIINQIIERGFDKEGINQLEIYGELFSRGKLLFKRFSPEEQYGCTTGGSTHVIATILSGTEAPADLFAETDSDFKREIKYGAFQASLIERWAKTIGVWMDDVESFLKNGFGEKLAEGGEANVYDNGPTLIKSIGLDYFILPSLALNRISLHNTFFPETRMVVIGFGRDEDGRFKVIVEQPFIEGERMTEKEIEDFAKSIGFSLRNKRNWTYTTPNIYLSDLHDENVIKSRGGNIYVIDCDIRLNTPDLKLGGKRVDTNEVLFL